MTAVLPSPAAAPAAGLPPTPATPVLAARPLRPGTDPAAGSVFGDDRWYLTPAFFEDHTPSVSLNFTLAPAALREAAKRYTWQLLNSPDPPVIRGAPGRRLAVASIVTAFRGLCAFLHWLDARGTGQLCQVGAADFDAYLADLLATGHSRGVLRERVDAVRRLWFWRDRLPACDRLPQAPPWGGEGSTAVLGGARRPTENRTPRIPAPVMDRLLLWSLRFVEDFAGDILAIRQEYTALAGRTVAARRPGGAAHTGRAEQEFTAEVAALLARLAAAGTPLPGRPGPGGAVLDREHLGRLLNCPTYWLKRRTIHQMIEGSGLPVADGAYLGAPVLGRLGGHPWRDRPITFTEAEALLQHLLTAAFVVLAYLSGMRPGENRAELHQVQQLNMSRMHQ